MQDSLQNILPKDLDEEIAKIKSKLHLNQSLSKDSPLNLSKISDIKEGNTTISMLSGSLIDIKLSELNQKLFTIPQEADRSPTSPKSSMLHQYKQREKNYILEIESLLNKLNQYEVDLQYCIDQNQSAFDELTHLKSLLIQKDEIIEKLRYDAKPSLAAGKINYKWYSEFEFLKAENMRLSKEITKIDNKNKGLECQMREAEFKYNELLGDVTSLRKSNLAVLDENGITVEVACKRIENANLDFQRKISSNLEKENKELHEDNEYLKAKLLEIESNLSKEKEESGYIKELITQLGLSTEKELYKKVLCLQELSKQSKEQRALIQKLATYISQKTCKQQVTCKEIWSYLSKILR